MPEEYVSQGRIQLDLSDLSADTNVKKWIKFFEKPIKILTKITVFEMYLNDIDKDNSAGTIWEKWLKHLQISCKPIRGTFDTISKSNRIIFIANHPLGLLDCIALTAVIKQIRPEAKILANPALQPLMGLTNDIVESEKSAVQSDTLIVFPSNVDSVLDAVWESSIGEMILNSAVSVVPIFFHGKNSKLFYYLSHLNQQLSPLLSINECLKKRGSTLYYSIGEIINPDKFRGLTSAVVIDFIREAVYKLKN